MMEKENIKEIVKQKPKIETIELKIEYIVSIGHQIREENRIMKEHVIIL